MLRATIRRASYLGSAVDYEAQVEASELVLRVTAPVSPRLKPGDTATLAIDPAVCVPVSDG
jgi:hypothetical protein